MGDQVRARSLLFECEVCVLPGGSTGPVKDLGGDLNLIREERARYGGREISRRTGSPLLSIHSSRLFLVTKSTGAPKRQAMRSAWARGVWRVSLVLVNFGVGVD